MTKRRPKHTPGWIVDDSRAIGRDKDDVGDPDHICVYDGAVHDMRGYVSIHTDNGPIYLTPEQATNWAAKIAEVANEVAERHEAV